MKTALRSIASAALTGAVLAVITAMAVMTHWIAVSA